MKWPEMILFFVMVVAWVVGIAVSKGFWMIIGSIAIPPMAWVVMDFIRLPFKKVSPVFDAVQASTWPPRNIHGRFHSQRKDSP